MAVQSYEEWKASKDNYISFDEIMDEADRIAQVRKDAKIIAQEVIKELNKWEESKEKAAQKTVPETIPVETVEVVVVQEPEPDNTTLVVSSIGSFFLGVLVTSLFFIAKIRQIRKEHEMW